MSDQKEISSKLIEKITKEFANEYGGTIDYLNQFFS